MAGEILEPKFLVLPKVADATSAAPLAAEKGSLTYDLNTDKLGFVTASGATEETVTSV